METDMKYVVLLCDGMADYPLAELDGKTPMGAAVKPHMDALARKGQVGLVKTVADHLKPGSDVANLSVLGYDPAGCYTGRSPLEAGSIGIDMKETDVSFRCNLVTLSDEERFEDRTMIDYCADDISTAEAAELIAAVHDALGSDEFTFYAGVSYRHCLIWDHGTLEIGTLTPPHDITGKPIATHLSAHENAAPLLAMMRKSGEILRKHPVNLARISRGLRPANSIWLWGEGVRASLAPFKQKYGLDGSMISAVDLLKGIGKFAGMQVVQVEGATGYLDTNFEGKCQAALDELASGQNFVYIHVEAPDECGHRHEIENKKLAIEEIDRRILGPLLDGMERYRAYKILVVPDHATPLSLRTHTNDPVPYLFYAKGRDEHGVERFDEEHAEATGVFCEHGHELMTRFLAY